MGRGGRWGRGGAYGEGPARSRGEGREAPGRRGRGDGVSLLGVAGGRWGQEAGEGSEQQEQRRAPGGKEKSLRSPGHGLTTLVQL